MATFGSTGAFHVTKHNMLKGKTNKLTENEQRPVLKEVGNKVQNVKPTGKDKDDQLSKAAPLVNVKPVAKKKQPSIQVKETKACSLMGQYNRLSIDKNTLPPPATAVAAPAATTAVNLAPIPRVLVTKPAERAAKTKTTLKAEPKPLLEPLRTLETGAFSNVLLESVENDEDIDKQEENNPLMLGPYTNDMYIYLRQMELNFPITRNYLEKSKVSSEMRATLIDWIIDVQQELDMMGETLYLTVAIIDRFLQERLDISRLELQLVGATAMYVAVKYEEILIPDIRKDIRKVVYVCDNVFTKKELIKMEIDVIKTLDYSFGRPLPIHFLRRYSRAASASPLELVMAKYILEVSLLQYELCHERPSLIAAAAIYISLWLLRHKKQVWSKQLVKYSTYRESEVLSVVRKLASAVLAMEKSKHQSVQKKYAQAKAFQVSTLPELKSLGDLVKETKACSLMVQYNRLSIDKNTLPPPATAVAAPAATTAVNLAPIPRVLVTKPAEQAAKTKTTLKAEPKPLLEPLRTLETGAFSNVLLESVENDEDIDKQEENNPLMLGPYTNDMYIYLRQMELNFPITRNYLEKSKVSSEMRATLIDWIIDVQQELDMMGETLYLTVAIIDRFLQERLDISRLELQLVGATAMYVAVKYEEILIPDIRKDIRKVVYVCDNVFTKKELIKMEIDVIKTLDYSFGRPLPIHFLRRYSRAASASPLELVMAKYILEVSLLQYELCHERPSLIAAAAIYISLWLLRHKKQVWSKQLVTYSTYRESEVLSVVRKLASAVLAMEKSKHQSVQKKYAQAKAFQVSTRPELKSLGDLVKETKACSLMVQYNRLSIDKNTLPPPATAVAAPATTTAVNLAPIPRVLVTKPAERAAKTKTTLKAEPKPLLEPLRTLETGAFSNVLLESVENDEDIDKQEENNPLMLGPYTNDMYIYLRQMELNFPITRNYLEKSKVSSKMRATFIDWIIDVQQEFDMMGETLYLTVAIIDRFLQERLDISRLELQLVGATAMYVAAKYEEILIPDIRELVYVFDNVFTKKELIKMEIGVIKILDYSFGRPLPIHFLRRYSRAASASPLELVMAKYILEVSLLQYELCHERPSLIAAAAIYISLWLLRHKKQVWSKQLVKYSTYRESEVLSVVRKLASAVLAMEKSKHQSVQKKYAQAKAFQVSTLPELKSLGDLVEKRVQRAIADQPIMEHAGANVNLTISSSSLVLTALESGRAIAGHEMPRISFASGGDTDTLDFVAYVAKDLKDWRACYVLECGGGLAQDVITTIGQAFELRFKEFLTQPSFVTNVLNGDDRDYYNDLPGKIPPELSPPPVPPLPNLHNAQAASKPSTSVSVSITRDHHQARETERPPVRDAVSVSSNLIDLNWEAPPSVPAPPPVPAPRREHDYVNDIMVSNNRDVFDMQPFSAAMSADILTPASQRVQLQKEVWFHGPDGDFLVRESQGSPGQYVLTGMQGGIKKHLLLVDPEGIVRTKDRMFESVSHLINYHCENELPIISAESALVLRRPVHRQQQN